MGGSAAARDRARAGADRAARGDRRLVQKYTFPQPDCAHRMPARVGVVAAAVRSVGCLRGLPASATRRAGKGFARAWNRALDEAQCEAIDESARAAAVRSVGYPDRPSRPHHRHAHLVGAPRALGCRDFSDFRDRVWRSAGRCRAARARAAAGTPCNMPATHRIQCGWASARSPPSAPVLPELRGGSGRPAFFPAHPGRWHTASILAPSGSSTNAA
jgi:hypothetical protein